MRSLARPSFFRMFDLLLATTNPGLQLTRWTHEGAQFERERYSFTSPRQGPTIEIITVSRSGRGGWSLMVTKEYWWSGAESKPFKITRWARPLSGPRADLMASIDRKQANGFKSLLRASRSLRKPQLPQVLCHPLKHLLRKHHRALESSNGKIWI
jgi:hypothetical protein